MRIGVRVKSFAPNLPRCVCAGWFDNRCEVGKRALTLKSYDPYDMEGGYWLCAALILLAGAFLRFHQLGAPSMWTDEMLVALNASKSASYILSLSENVEVHPPYFYFLYKPLLGEARSDFWLRLPSAVFGTLTLLLLWRAGERHLGSRPAALAAMALLAVHPLHIWISRQLRPYSLIGMMGVLAMWNLLNYLEHGRGRDARLNLLACLPVVMCHYLGLMLLAAQWAVALARSVATGVPRLVSVVWFGLGCAACAAPVAYFFWAAKFSRAEAVIEGGKSLPQTLETVGAALAGVLAFGADFPFAWLTPALLAAIGAVALVARRSVAGWIAALVALPPLMLVAARYASHLYAVHLSFLLPALTLLAGAGLDWALPRSWRRPWLPLMLCLCMGGLFLAVKGKDYYDAKGVVATWWHMGFYRDIGRAVSVNFKPSDMIAFQDTGLYQSVNWYASQNVPSGAPSSQRLEPGSPAVMAAFVTNYGEFGHLFPDEARFKQLYGQSASVAMLDNVRLYQASLARKPEIAMESGRVVEELTADPRDVYSRAWTLHDLTVWPYFRGALMPTKPREPGEVVYRLAAPDDGAPREFRLLADFEMEAPGNLMLVEYRFDGEPWTPLVEESSFSRGTCRLARFAREKPYSHLWLRAVLRAGEETATSVYGGLEQVRLSRLLLFSEGEGALFGSRSMAVHEKGLGTLELFPGKTLARWGLGGGSSLGFAKAGDGKLRLRYAFTSRIPGQTVEVLAGGRRAALHEALEAGQESAGELELEAPAGPGGVEFRYAAWNHKDEASTFAPGDPREIAVLFTALSIEDPDHAGPPPPPQVLPK